MKKIINRVEAIVDDFCYGIVRANPEKLARDERYRIIRRKQPNARKVTLISGGGSGHEPSHAGYVGVGMLDAAVCGDIFASPSSVQVYNAILQTRSEKGTLLIVKNYSGDRMNFDTAAEMAVEEGMAVEKVYTNDDIAVLDSQFTIGRRGVAGTVFVHKIAGAAAEKGLDLAAVKAVAEKVIANVRTIGFALSSCTVPAKGTPTFSIGDGEMEYGVGIHGESGIAREKLADASSLAHRMVHALALDLRLAQGDEIALMINGLGATPLVELHVLGGFVFKELDLLNLKVHASLVGNYMTSLDMAGASITLLKLDAAMKELLDSPADTPAMRM
jgi:dihydroxyacetone kinase DhaK subunit